MKPTIKITRKNKEFHISTGGGVHLNERCVIDSSGVLGAYPIGSIYLSVNDTSPASLFGGTWEKIQDRFLLASGSSYSLGATGGEATHTLTAEEMPKHIHHIYNPQDVGLWSVPVVNGYVEGDTYVSKIFYSAEKGNATASNRVYAAENGGSQPHNNMPPYLVVNVWKRIS